MFEPWGRKIPWRRKWQPTPVSLPGESHGRRRLAGCSPWDLKELDSTDHTHTHTHIHTHTHTHTYIHTYTHTPEGTLSSQPLDFSPLRMNLDFDLQNYKIINLCYFQPPGLWQFVTAVIANEIRGWPRHSSVPPNLVLSAIVPASSYPPFWIDTLLQSHLDDCNSLQTNFPSTKLLLLRKLRTIAEQRPWNCL